MQLVQVLSAMEVAAKPVPSVEHTIVSEGTLIGRAATAAGPGGDAASEGEAWVCGRALGLAGAGAADIVETDTIDDDVAATVTGGCERLLTTAYPIPALAPTMTAPKTTGSQRRLRAGRVGMSTDPPDTLNCPHQCARLPSSAAPHRGHNSRGITTHPSAARDLPVQDLGLGLPSSCDAR